MYWGYCIESGKGELLPSFLIFQCFIWFCKLIVSGSGGGKSRQFLFFGFQATIWFSQLLYRVREGGTRSYIWVFRPLYRVREVGNSRKLWVLNFPAVVSSSGGELLPIFMIYLIKATVSSSGRVDLSPIPLLMFRQLCSALVCARAARWPSSPWANFIWVCRLLYRVREGLVFLFFRLLYHGRVGNSSFFVWLFRLLYRVREGKLSPCCICFFRLLYRVRDESIQ